MDKLFCTEENAEKFGNWLDERGGLAVWMSADLSDPAASWTTPAQQWDGSPTPKPHWKANDRPQIITDPEKVIVTRDEEVKRFHVSILIGRNGMKYKLTDGSSSKLRKALAAAGEDAHYVFDYATQEAVILKPTKQMNLKEWLRLKQTTGEGMEV